ncbi:amidase [Halobacillus sp. A1]|uniref:amidase n=1 Tax=Halobacillus sp. A1 TaxID=2880262 RepID=UPI0020A69709|nr:amidase [Halobacillus sp. A1]MCP3029918.1 amidase [Halobacillus sp. A1]
MQDHYNAYVDTEIERKPSGSGKLNGLTFSVKDVYSIEGYSNHAGNPDWLRTHNPAERTAPVITKLLKNGARLKGTTHTDELMYSLNGENYHYGTPENPEAKGHIPGGSSSGSAVAVAAGNVDFALGTDTGGSVRVPSSYCGIYGFRPTHGAVDSSEVIPLAESFDTVGWMARDPQLLYEIGRVLLPELPDQKFKLDRVLKGKDAWGRMDPEAKENSALFIPYFEQMSSSFEDVEISKEGLDEWFGVFKILQGLEIGQEHGEWIQKENPTFGPGIAERFQWTQTLKKEEHLHEFKRREEIQKHMKQLLGEDGLLIIPTVPGAAPKQGLPPEELEERRAKTMELLCIAGLAGLPQLTIPIGKVDGKPAGVSIVANQHKDINLLAWAVKFQEKVSSLHLEG